VKIVGLHMENGRVSAAIVEKGMRGAELKDSFSVSVGSDAELIAILKERSRDWVGARIIASIPGEQFSQHLVHFPFSDRKRIEKALPFEIEESVPFPLDDVVLDHVVLGENAAKGTETKGDTPVLAIMLPKTVLRKHLDLLAAAGIDPQAIVPSSIGLLVVARMVPVDGAALLVAGRDLCLKNNGTVLAFRSLSASQPTGGAAHTLKAFELAHGVTVEKMLVLTADNPEGWDDMGIALEHVAPEFKGKKSAEPVSLGLALSGEINFRKGEYAYRLANEGIRKRKRTLIVAGIIAALLAVTNLGVKYYVVQSGYGKLDSEIREIYRKAVPDAKSTADPVRQLKTRLDEAGKKFGVLGTGSSALDAMRAVTDGVPKEIRVSFSEFSLENDRLKLQGEAQTFEAIDKIKAELQKAAQFSEVLVLDTRMGVDNKVKFRIDIKIKPAS